MGKMKMLPEVQYEPCEECEGEGVIEYDVPVPKPHGEGYIKGVFDKCYVCGGTGSVEVGEDQ